MRKLFSIIMILISCNIYGQSGITSITKSDTFYIHKIKKYKTISIIHAKNNIDKIFKIVYRHSNVGQSIKKGRKYYLEISTVGFEMDGKNIGFIPNRIMCSEYDKGLKICTEPENGITEIYDLIEISNCL